MAGGFRWLAIILVGYLLLCTISIHAEGQATAPAGAGTPPVNTEEVTRMLELGKLLMGQNNPVYAGFAMKLEMDTRNAAGAQALRTFYTVVKLDPQSADAWLWLGIALTETLYYSKEAPQGQRVSSETNIAEGIQAFKNAYDRAPADITCVKYYGEALMTYRRDFDAARKLWESYLPMAASDLQRVVALVQSARASLNKAAFGKANKMPINEVRLNFLEAEKTIQLAAKLCPKADDVKEMQALLQQYRKILYGK